MKLITIPKTIAALSIFVLLSVAYVVYAFDSITVDQAIINAGDSTTLRWNLEQVGRSGCTMYAGSGPINHPAGVVDSFSINLTGTRTISPSETVTYYATCWEGGVLEMLTPEAQVTVRSCDTPTANLRVKGGADTTWGSSVTLNVGDTISYDWDGTNGTSYYSTVDTACHGGWNDVPWEADDSGPNSPDSSGTIQSSQSGCSYTMTYYAKNACNDLAQSSITVNVNEAVDCVGEWNATGCTAECGGGNVIETYTITTESSNGGEACPYKDGDTRTTGETCNTQACPQPGVCGSADGQSFYTQPNANLCSSAGGYTWTDVTVPFGDDWNWRCDDIGGAADASCAAGRNYDASCGSADGGAFTSAPALNLCNPGYIYWRDSDGDDGTYNWECYGAYDGADDLTCSATRRTSLTVQKNGTGSGLVTGTGINCGTDCYETYNFNTNVTLAAAPSEGSVFAGWSGGGCSGVGSCVVTMNQAQTVTATFNLEDVTAPTLTFVANPTTITLGDSSELSWTVVGDADSCWASGGWSGWKAFSGTHSEMVTPASVGTFNYYLECWNSDVSSGQKQAVVQVMNVPTYTLDVAVVGDGQVTSDVVGISCPSDCTEAYEEGTTVQLTAQPGTGALFSGWSGACSGTGVCSITMNADISVTATFDTPPPSTGDCLGLDPAYAASCNQPAPASDTNKVVVNSCNPAGYCEFTCTGTYNGSPYKNVNGRCVAGYVDVDPSTIPSGGTTVVDWSTSNVGLGMTCKVEGGDSEWLGAAGNETSPSLFTDTTYYLSCEDVPLDSVTVTVLDAPEIDASPRVIEEGGTTDITWTVPDPTLCSLSGGGYEDVLVSDIPGGKLDDVQLFGTTIFTIDCGTYGDDSVTVEVVPKGYET